MAKLDASEVAYAGREGLSRGSERLRGHPGARENEGVEMHVKHWSGIGWSADKAAGERSLAERPQRLRKPMYIYEF